MTTNCLTITAIVRPMAVNAGVARTGRIPRAMLGLPAMLLLSWPLAPARAQTPCATTGTNQTCTNSVLLSGGLDGIKDTAVIGNRIARQCSRTLLELGCPVDRSTDAGTEHNQRVIAGRAQDCCVKITISTASCIAGQGMLLHTAKSSCHRV